MHKDSRVRKGNSFCGVLAVEVHSMAAICRNGIPLHDLAAFVDGEGGLAGGEGDAAKVAAGAFAVGFCPVERGGVQCAARSGVELSDSVTEFPICFSIFTANTNY